MDDSRPAPQIREVPARLIAGISRDYTMATRHRIPTHFRAWFDAEYRIPEAIEGALFGVSFGHTKGEDGQGAFKYAVGVEVEGRPATMPDGTCIVTTEDGPHAVFSTFGPVAELPRNLDWLVSEWLPESEHGQRTGPIYERYPDDPRNGSDGISYEIWVPISTGS